MSHEERFKTIMQCEPPNQSPEIQADWEACRWAQAEIEKLRRYLTMCGEGQSLAIESCKQFMQAFREKDAEIESLRGQLEECHEMLDAVAKGKGDGPIDIKFCRFVAMAEILLRRQKAQSAASRPG